MIGYIKGSLEYIGEGYVIIETGGIGYNINVTSSTASRLTKTAGDVRLFTVMNVREDAITLYGFAEKEELEMYKMLVTVSGIGPKGAVSMLSSLSPSRISLAVITGDVKTLATGQGIGKKTAERIVLELKDKIKTEDAITAGDQTSVETAEITGASEEKREAVEALISLGFSRSEAFGAAAKVYEKNMEAAEIIKLALKSLSK